MKHNLEWGREYCLPTMLLGVMTECSVLILARGSQWFASPQADRPSLKHWRVQCSRFGLVALMLCLFSPLCYLFYRLMTPTPYPVVEMPAENGWDDFVAAGEAMNDSQNGYSNMLQSVRNGTAAQAKAAIDQVRPVLDRIEQGLSKTQFQLDRSPWAVQFLDENGSLKEFRFLDAIQSAYSCQGTRLDFAVRFGSPRSQITELTKILRFGSFFNTDTSFDWSIGYYAELRARSTLNRMVSVLNAQQCQQVVSLLFEYDKKRGSLENRKYYQRLADENHGWLVHLDALLQEWSAEGPYAWQCQQYLNNVRHTRMLIIQFALQRYFLENQRLPENLAELVPEYLPAILVDPHTNKPFHYQHLWGGYALTTLDEDVEDRALVTGPAAPYLWQRLQELWHGF